jgi:type II secretory ATPase GspE/PulE/Tfp pilus assembly ATPase PilB-like protein
MDVRFRLDGVLRTVETLPAAMAQSVVARLKVLAGVLTYRNDVPQEGRIELDELPDTAGSVRVRELRLATFPTLHGQRAVVRIFADDTSLRTLDQLSLPPAMVQSLREITARGEGMLLLSGPAGSGKSTTLAALLRSLVADNPGRSIVTLEDPVEQVIEGVTQVPISNGGEMTFPLALRSLLRQDPEILMIGEIRDAETARIATQAGLTGHLVLTTLHSGRPEAALLRLLEMGVEPYQVTSSVQAVVNQRLLRRLCGACRRPVERGGFEPGGCEACMGIGYRGRLPVAELLRMDGALRRAVLDGADVDELSALLRRRGHMTLRQAGRGLVAEGQTSLAELDSACPPEDGDQPSES